MKKLENKETEMTQEIEGEKVKMGYVDLLLLGLNSAGKIEGTKMGKTVELEDAEFKVAFDCRIKNWAMMHKDIVAFDEYLEKLNK